MRDFRAILLENFGNKRKSNSAYSLRAFARDLGVSASALSQVLSSKRKFSVANARKVAAELGLIGENARQFVLRASYNGDSMALPTERRLLEEDQFELIANWYHLAILNLAKIRGCNASPLALSERLGLDSVTVKLALESLSRLGLIEIRDGILIRTSVPITTTEDVASRANRSHHRQRLELAKAALERVAIEKREILSLTFPLSPDRLPRLKEKIRRFADQLARSAEGPAASEVYSLGVELIPLTKQT